MLITSLGNAPDGKLRLIVGLTPKDLFYVLERGGATQVKGQDENNPLPIHLALMVGDTDEDMQQVVREWMAEAEKESPDAEDDV